MLFWWKDSKSKGTFATADFFCAPTFMLKEHKVIPASVLSLYIEIFQFHFFITAVNRLTAQTWCIENGFELVELDPESSSDSEIEGQC